MTFGRKECSMASVQFDGGKCHGAGEAKAMLRHADKDERLIHTHSNEDIDKSRTPLNTDLHGLSYNDMCEQYDAAIEEYRQRANRAIRKDAVTLYDAIITVPKDLPADREDDWYRDVEKTINDHYGKAVVLDIKIHRDEIHEYTDPATKQKAMSRTHGHCFMFPDVDGKLNAKKFSSRANMRGLNREIDAMTRDKYHVQFLTGEKAVDRGFQTVEQLKRAADNEALIQQTRAVREDAQKAQDEIFELRIEENNIRDSVAAQMGEYGRLREQTQKIIEYRDVAKQQRLDALRSRDAARADYDVTRQLQKLADTMKYAKMPSVEILRETEARTNVFGKSIPATVTIRKEDFDQLRRTAGQLALMRQLVDQLEEILDSFKKWAAKAFMNKIDARQILADQKVQEIQADLDKANRQWSLWQQDSRDKDQTIKGLSESAALGERFARIRASFPEVVDRLERIGTLERKFDNRGLSKAALREYQDLCGDAGVDPRGDMTEALRRKGRDRGDDWDLGR